jgi:outer membrane lipoprotein-sorting protein
MHFIRLAFVVFLVLSTAVNVMAAPLPRVNVSLQDAIDTVEKSYRALNDITADFFQRSIVKDKHQELRAEGQMSLKMATDREPLMFRFDYYRPTTQEIVSNGKTMWTYLPGNRQVIISDVSFVFDPFRFNPDRDRASNFLQGLGRFSKDFETTFSSQRMDAEGNYVLELTPKRSAAYIQKIFLLVHRDSVMNYSSKRNELGRPLTQVEFQQFLRQHAQQQPKSGPLGPLRTELQAFPLLSTTVIDHQGNSTVMEFSNVKTDRKLTSFLFNFTIPANVQTVRPPRQP